MILLLTGSSSATRTLSSGGETGGTVVGIVEGAVADTEADVEGSGAMPVIGGK